MSGDIVPFGKYKGRFVGELVADHDYCKWLSEQSWFRDKFAYIHQLIVVNPNAEPADTPEHNAMQALFLDKNMQAACVLRVRDIEKIYRDNARYQQQKVIQEIKSCEERIEDNKERINESKSGEFSNDDWVIKNIERYKTANIRNLEKIEELKGKLQELYSAVPLFSHWEITASFESGGYDIALESQLTGGLYESITIGVELKPTIGDDYPTVIRQIKKGRAFVNLLVYETATWLLPDATARAVVEASGIRIASLAEITELAQNLPKDIRLSETEE